MPTFTPQDLRAAAAFLESLDGAAYGAEPGVSVTISSPVVEVDGKSMGSVQEQDGIHVLWIDRC